ncbi:MAG: diadenylate cyclase [Candidatus Calescibacterium sp.]|jgi:diadenylate cyclase|nr:diadenylate cyclase [Candidatus Calescibacterium sp.]
MVEIFLVFLKLVLDVAILSFIIYKIISLSYDPRIIGAIIFFGGLFTLNIFAKAFSLPATWWLTDKFTEYSILVLIVLFQPELRRTILGIRLKFFERGIDELVLKEVVEACKEISERKEGALIVLERSVDVTSIIHGGLKLDADVSAKLLVAIFNKESPTHDGAVIIRKSKIHMVGTTLPVTTREFGLEIGMRHRAGIGITEFSDAISIIISEKTGRISVAHRGELVMGVPPQRLQSVIENIIGKQKKTKS